MFSDRGPSFAGRSGSRRAGAFFRLLRAGELRFTARVFFMRRLSRVGRSRAFTLVELLTVIAVIA
ncbi:MAG TPA: prepilin-type N-terminal cleavage/methylation domain-containing protein, partial [Opitutaceae bacterium]|nr:prepilin-type N-terminal cleavage/methylation domain-containing protein [Opitutaceae bacterium]